MAEISKIVDLAGTAYDLKDSTARTSISTLRTDVDEILADMIPGIVCGNDASTIPYGIQVGTSTIGTLVPSADTLGKIYYVPSKYRDIIGVRYSSFVIDNLLGIQFFYGDMYDAYITVCNASGYYGWEKIGGVDDMALDVIEEQQTIIEQQQGTIDAQREMLDAMWNTLGTGPLIYRQPEDLTVDAGTAVTFTTLAIGTGLRYQWQWRKGSSGTWANSSGTSATTDTLSVSATTGRNGYQYHCIVTDGNGDTATSDTATLTVSSD